MSNASRRRRARERAHADATPPRVPVAPPLAYTPVALVILACLVIGAGIALRSTVALVSGEVLAVATMLLTVLLLSCAPDDARGVCETPPPTPSPKEDHHVA